MFEIIDATKHSGFKNYSNDDVYVRNPYVIMLTDLDGRKRPLIIKDDENETVVGYTSIVEG